MDVKIRHESEAEGILICSIYKPEQVVEIVKTLSRAGGVWVSSESDFSNDLRYRFVYSGKCFYAEIVIGSTTEPQA